MDRWPERGDKKKKVGESNGIVLAPAMRARLRGPRRGSHIEMESSRCWLSDARRCQSFAPAGVEEMGAGLHEVPLLGRRRRRRRRRSCIIYERSPDYREIELKPRVPLRFLHVCCGFAAAAATRPAWRLGSIWRSRARARSARRLLSGRLLRSAPSREGGPPVLKCSAPRQALRRTQTYILGDRASSPKAAS